MTDTHPASSMQEPSPAGQDALLRAQLEIRDLQATIGALRTELEERAQQSAEEVEAVRARCEAETRDLRATIVRLRQELEDAMAVTRERVLDETREHRDTIEHHMATIRALRHELEARGQGSDDQE